MARMIAVAALLVLALVLAPAVASAQVAPDSLPGDPGGQIDNPIVVKPKPAQVPSVLPPEEHHADPGPPLPPASPSVPLAEPSPVLIGVHAAAGRVSVAFDNPNPTTDAGWGPWFDGEVGFRFAPRVSLLAFGAFAFDSGAGNNRYQHLVLGARAQYAVAPRFWLSGGVAIVRERAQLDTLTMAGEPTTVVDIVWQPGAELRAGYEVWRTGNIGFDVVFDGLAFRREAGAFASTIATLGLGAQWR